MRRLILFALMLMLQLSAMAQSRPKFDPARFEADLEQYVTTEAGLSAKEAAAFFPIYKEMRKKQRMLFMKMDKYRHVDFCDNKQCENAIRSLDEIDIQMKELQQRYHVKFMNILPASKVLKVIRAEERFHRRAFRKAAGAGHNGNKAKKVE